MNTDLMIKAYKMMKDASYQSHDGHWDYTGEHGKNCRECERANKLRNEADKLFEEAKKNEV